MGETYPVSSLFIFFSIIGATFLLEDPATLTVGSLIAKKEVSFFFGFSALTLGIFLGDLGLYTLGYLFKEKIFSSKKSFLKPAGSQVALARFLPGARTITFLAAGYGGFPLKKFLLIILPSSVIWTLLLLLFTKQVFSLTHVLPNWGNWIVGLILIVSIVKFRTLMKVFSMITLITFVIIHHYFFLRNSGRRELSASLSRYCQIALRILDVQVNSQIQAKDFSGKLVVSNHMSYLDVICLSSVYPCVYVTSTEIQQTPVLGLLCELFGCIFTERRHALRNSDLREKELKEIQMILNEGVSLTLFPEGTSSNGQKVLPFKSTLFEGALRTQASTQTILLRYDEIRGEKFSAHNADVVCWYGKMGFIPHFIRLCDSKGIKASITAVAELKAVDYQDRKALASVAHRAIEEAHLKTL